MRSTVWERVGESLGAVRGVFGNRDIRRIQLAFAGSIVGYYAYSIGVSVYAYRHGGATAVGVFNFIRLAAGAAVAPLAASLTDRLRRERVMLAADLIRVGTVGGAAAAVLSHAPPLVTYALAVATTIVGTVFRPAVAALLPTLARTPDELTAANVSSSTFDSLGSFAGPALGALLLVAGGPGTVFVLTAATFAWSALLISRVHAAPPAGAEAEEDVHGGLWGGVRAIRAEPRLRLLIGLYGAQCLVAGSLAVLVVATALQQLKLGNAGVGLLEAACGVGSLVGAAVALALLGRRRLAGDFGLGIVLWGAPLVILGAWPNVGVAVAALALVGLGNTLVDISAVTLLQRTAAPEVAGRVFGVLESMLVGSLGAGALLAPALIALVGIRSALVAIGAFLPVLVALRWRTLGHIDEGLAVPEERLAAVRLVPFLASLPAQGVELLAARLEATHLDPGEVLFRAGDPGDRFYIVTAGAVEIVLPEGSKVQPAPCYVGEIALLRDVPRTATVQATEACALWAVEREDFLSAVRGHARSHTAADEFASARLGIGGVA